MTPDVLLDLAAAGMATALAAIALGGRPRTLPRWAFAAGMLLLAADSVLVAMSAHAVLPEEAVRWQTWRLVARSFIPGTWLVFSLTFSRGNASDFLQRWNFPVTAAFVVPPAVALLFFDELIIPYRHEPANLIELQLGTAGVILYVLFLLASVLVLMNLERTLRASVGTMRWRIKFMMLGLGLLFAVRVYSSSQALVFKAVMPDLGPVNAAGLLVGGCVILVAFKRAGFAEVSVFPSQAVLRNSFTILVAGAYLLIVGSFAKVTEFLGGDTSFTTKAFVVLIALVLFSTLLVSDRARLHTKRFFSHYFQRPLYDYGSVWRSFIANTSSRVEKPEFCRAVVHLVSELFQVLSVTIWLVDDKRETLTFGASTSLPGPASDTIQPRNEDAVQVVRAFRDRREPVDIESSGEPWCAALRRCTPDDFRKGGNRLCVPISAAGELFGIITLGDRVGGIHFTIQEIELLKCIGDQTGASLRNLQLSERLMHARELEAFQTMSAFFVHDLKNTASTLSLMLQNLPVHFNDPAFREDALRGISRTVTHINHLISRLSLLRQELPIRLVESDLNQVITSTLAELPGPDSQVTQNLRPLPKVPLDPDQLRKVITNLLLNARDAIPANGEIRVETSRENGWVILSVSDNGCGMSRDFIDRSLFRPFQTTKKQGIGIGMFQSRMIVEAHRGKIEVESDLGRGTTFRVFLPQSNRNESEAAHR